MKRRTVLKSAACTGVLGASTSQLASASHLYDWSLHATVELYNNKGDTPQERSEDYVTAAFNSTDDITYSYSSPDDTVDAPVEELGQSFETSCPCHQQYTCQYGGILPWWREYGNGDCTFTPNSDSNILLTNNDGAGVAYRSGKFGINANALNTGKAPSTVDEYGSGGGYESLSTLLEEMGHNFQMTDNEKGENFNPEKTGAEFYDDDSEYISPLGEGAQGETNECGYSVPDCGTRKAIKWAPCSYNDYWG